MPAGDRTGPSGLGRMSGRMSGLCAGYGAPGFMNSGCGYRMQRMGRYAPDRNPGGFFRRRFRFRDDFRAGTMPWAWYEPDQAYETNPEVRNQFLKREAEILENRLADLKKMMSEQDVHDKPS